MKCRLLKFPLIHSLIVDFEYPVFNVTFVTFNYSEKIRRGGNKARKIYILLLSLLLVYIFFRRTQRRS